MKSILVPIDGSIHARAAIEIACDLAEKHEAEIRFLHVLLMDRDVADLLLMPDLDLLEDSVSEQLHQINQTPAEAPTADTLMQNPEGPLRSAPRDLLVTIGTGILQAAEAAAKARGVSSRALELHEGEPAQKVVEAARQEAVDSIIMGSRGLSNINAMTIGSVSQLVCQKAPCSCIIVH